MRLESVCGPLVHIFAILSTDLILVLFLLLPSLLRKVVYVTDYYFLHNLLQNNTSYTWNVVYCININTLILFTANFYKHFR